MISLKSKVIHQFSRLKPNNSEGQLAINKYRLLCPGSDLSVFYVSNLPLITWIRPFREPFCVFNVCFHVNRENMQKMLICTKRCTLEVFGAKLEIRSQP